MKISIITPVFGKSEITSKFIRGIVPYLDGGELIIIDNNSPDNTLALVGAAKKSHPNADIKLYSHNVNAGFGAANNIGAKLAKSDKLLFISNDVEIHGDLVNPVVSFLESDGRAACGPRLLSYDTGWNTYKEMGTIPYLEGFCFALHKWHFDLVSGFDENFFLDMEDLDLSLRLRFAGVALAQINLPVMHILGGSFSNLTTSRADITSKSRQYFMQKWNLTI